MSFSLTYNGTDLSTYGLIVNQRTHPFTQTNTYIQLPAKSYPTNPTYPVRQCALDITIQGSDGTDLKSKYDSIMLALASNSPRELILDWLPDRYWMATIAGMNVLPKGPATYTGQLVFESPDPYAYAITETESPYTIDDPVKDFTETVGGTAETFPTYTLTCDDTLTGVTVSLENLTTGKKIEWTGDLVATDVLIIDTEQKTIRLNGVLSVSGIGTPNFPSMLPGDNDMEVLEFSGDLNINYSERYA